MEIFKSSFPVFSVASALAAVIPPSWAPTCEIWQLYPLSSVHCESYDKTCSRSSIRCQEAQCPGLTCPSLPLSPTSTWHCQCCSAQLSSQQVLQRFWSLHYGHSFSNWLHSLSVVFIISKFSDWKLDGEDRRWPGGLCHHKRSSSSWRNDPQAGIAVVKPQNLLI